MLQLLIIKYLSKTPIQEYKYFQKKKNSGLISYPNKLKVIT